MSLKRKLIRYLCLRSHRSTVPTGLVPLSEMSDAVIFMDKPDDLSEPQKVTIQIFFKGYGVKLRFIYADDEDVRSVSDLFLSLSSEGGINERYAAVSSGARFKIGRRQIKGDVFDLVVTDNGPEPAPVLDAYKVIERFMVTIR